MDLMINRLPETIKRTRLRLGRCIPVQKKGSPDATIFNFYLKVSVNYCNSNQQFIF